MNFELSEAGSMIGRFGIVKLWPEIKAAEDECIARLKIAAAALGVECVEIHADGTFLADPATRASKETVDFVIHLHFDTPKNYDAFSFVALWNPVKFYHEWGYDRCSRNLTTHDDFLSCSSTSADDHVRRMIRNKGTHLPPYFKLYHSTADIVRPPSLGDGKLAYAGINWDALKGGKSRHQEVLKLLDDTGLLRIYGPRIFMDVQVWAGYKSYVKEVPFDGVSMVDEIGKAGISLVLSSQAHKDAELMSNRLFESIAAGALVICDENPFAKRYFGDCLLYIDSRSSPTQIVSDITAHIEWAHRNISEAIAKIESSQAIFRENFSLTNNLRTIYNELPTRKRQIEEFQFTGARPSLKVRLNMLMPEYSEELLNAHLQSIQLQDYPNISAVLALDTEALRENRAAIEASLASSTAKVELVAIDYYDHGIHADIKVRRRLGAVIQSLLEKRSDDDTDAFIVVGPNERLLSNHVTVLAAALQRQPDIDCAATAVILKDGDETVHSVHDVIDFGDVDVSAPNGYGRFVFRRSSVPSDVGVALPYLDGRPLAILAGNGAISQQLPATIEINLRSTFPKPLWDDKEETEIIRGYAPEAFRIAPGLMGPMRGAVNAAKARGSLLEMVFTRAWIAAQWRALKKHGIKSRAAAFKRRVLS
ncbi:hypothetical protein QO004_003739 [Rhizobium mesoamericanum]|uniref:hypothetical protein n=1 Tax=Rhizobium mesoamericanum TaxID=1079800 RepID=UPI002788D79D|nr:hypothetical protein [Rhizobium mesoamericanum]MDQ0561938.1 hypothetical protein [Rhizobium mesoamericanum]